MPDPRKLGSEDAPYEIDELDLTGEELDTQVQRAQDQLSDLRRRQDQIEKEKQRLEELSRKQDELESGRAELLEKFQRALTQLQRETAETQKRIEQLESITDVFIRHQQELQTMDPKAWSGAELPRELNRGLANVDEARADFVKLSPKISVEVAEMAVATSGTEYDEMYAGSDRSFAYWLVAGFAFTLPIFVLGVMALLLLAWKLSAVQ